MIKKYFFRLLTIYLFTTGCAQVVMPTGGEKDIVPPKVVKISPENESVNFDSKEIIIEFDEFTKLNQLKQQLIVSPPLKHGLNTKIKGKKLFIEIEDTLQPNTTYVLNFGNALVDLSENNPIPNFQYVFSTGSFIDSLELTGKVLDAFSLEVEKEVLVLLYVKEEKNDSLLFNGFPTYVGRTNESGEFKLSNIAEGKYIISALKESNDNFIYDRPDEKIAYNQATISLPKADSTAQTLFTFKEAPKKQYIETNTWKENELILKYIKPFNHLEFDFLDTVLSDILIDYRFSLNNDSATFWFKELSAQRFKLILNDDTSYTDTIRLKFDSIPKRSKLKITNTLTQKAPFHTPFTLIFNRLIEDFDTSKIMVMTADSNALEYKVLIDSMNRKKVYFVFNQESDSSYHVQLLPGAFTDVFERTWSDTLNQKISIDGFEDYGLLELEVDLEKDTGSFIIQLTDEQGKVLRSKPLVDLKANFLHLKPGSFRLKLILDENKNGRWDTGDYGKKIQAEKTFLYDESIQIRANWDKEIKWIIKRNL
tara:strand:+ start:7134 stop:8744 length:1611 start_codon:yes stop_codon:yes gene_type:complete